MSRYNIIYADPPWQFSDSCNDGRRGASHKYPVMSTKRLALLDVPSIAADDCALFMWAVSPMLGDALNVMARWGFYFKTVFLVWVKRGESGKLAWGMGHWSRANAELLLIGTRGSPKRQSASVHQILEAPRREHSAKPPEVRDRIVQLLGDVPRIELFARQRAEGWHSFGNQVPGGSDVELTERLMLL